MIRPMRTLLPFLLALALPSPALACGGFFCSQINVEPVQQNAERILFEINADGTITATVEIRYQGSPDAFSWVVPVPSELTGDDLDVAAPANALILLDDATTPAVIPPPTECNRPDVPGVMRSSDSAGFGGDDDDEGVEVIDLPVVGPFQPQMLRATDADVLVDWLNENDYLITPEMEPLIAEYVAGEMWFLALKLTPGADISDISPISMTYPGEAPMVPIQLTGVGAEPEMGVLTFIAGESRYESMNFDNLAIDADQIQVHPITGQQNYYPLLSWKMDEAGGHAVATQFSGDAAGAVQGARDRWSWNEDYADDLTWLDGVGQRHGQITRLYARLSAWEMSEDPVFIPSSGGAVSNVIDLSGRDPVDICADNASDRVLCGDFYCGEDAFCGNTDLGDGCLCPAGSTARRITAPILGGSGLTTTVVCDRLDSEMLGSLQAIGLAADDPCASESCGEHGTCLSLNGFATCSCEEGFAAVDDGSFLTCAQAKQTFEADRLLWATGCDDGCQASGGGAGGGLALLGLLGVVGRRRRG